MKDITRHIKTLPKVSQLGPNHRVLRTSYGRYLLSYDSVVVFRPFDDDTIYLGPDWDYSRTTGKFRNQFLGLTKADLESMLESGQAKLIEM